MIRGITRRESRSWAFGVAIDAKVMPIRAEQQHSASDAICPARPARPLGQREAPDRPTEVRRQGRSFIERNCQKARVRSATRYMGHDSRDGQGPVQRDMHPESICYGRRGVPEKMGGRAYFRIPIKTP